MTENRRRLVLTVAVVAAVVLGALLLIRKRAAELKNAPVAGAAAVPVRIAPVRKGDLVVERKYLAVVEPERRAEISPRLTSTVTDVPKDEGDRVAADDTLVRLDARAVEASLESLKARVGQTRSELEASRAREASLAESASYWKREAARSRELAAKGALPESDAEGAEDREADFGGRLKAAKSQSAALEHSLESLAWKISELETRVGYCTLRSPFDGVVTRRFVDPGDLAAPGKAVMIVEDRRTTKLVFDAPQEDLVDLKAGQEVRFRAGGEGLTGSVTVIHPALDRARMAVVEVDPGDGALLPASGSYLPVRVVLRRLTDAVLVPATALVPAGESRGVYVLEKGRLVLRPVKVLAISGETAAVGGLEPGREVVVSSYLGWTALSPGLAAEVVE